MASVSANGTLSNSVVKALLNRINSLLPSLQNMLNSIGPVSCIQSIICFYNVLSDQLEKGCNQSAAKLPLVLGAFLRSRNAMKQSCKLPLTPPTVLLQNLRSPKGI